MGSHTIIIYMCVTNSYWGQECGSWGSVGWNTGVPWGHKPQIALDRMDNNGKSLLARMTLKMAPNTCPAQELQESDDDTVFKSRTGATALKLILTLENPGPGDAGTYILGIWEKEGSENPWSLGKFCLRDMYLAPDWVPPHQQSKPLNHHMVISSNGIVAITNPTFEDTMAMETGYSDMNVWLEWMKYSNWFCCGNERYMCGSARPHLGTVPLNIPEDIEECFLSLFTKQHSKSRCLQRMEVQIPPPDTKPRLTESITIYPRNYTCYSSWGTGGRVVGNFTEGYCARYSAVEKEKVQNQVISLGDVYWICGDLRVRSRLVGAWDGEYALAKAIMPLHILPLHILPSDDDLPIAHTPGLTRQRRQAKPVPGSFDPHVYIDVIGIPTGVPNEFKARDQVKAGFESLIPMITINKNVDWINYIYYNQQRFVNYTRDALQGLADQLGPTSAMTFQNHMALDMPERGRVCKMLKGTGGSCCTFIRDNTGPTGKVTKAIKQLEDLSEELKKNSGITDPWDQYFGRMSGWQNILTQIGIVILVVMVLLAVIGCCVLPCIKKVVERTVESTTPVMLRHLCGDTGENIDTSYVSLQFMEIPKNEIYDKLHPSVMKQKINQGKVSM
uniref:Envelope protein n=1 Tax=Leptobrachium leishanense TaxID=445787 RepID=A0A8C5WFH2_9ANUR